MSHPSFFLLVDKTKPNPVFDLLFISTHTSDLQYSIEVDIEKVQHGMTPRGEFRLSTDTLTDIVTNITTLTFDQRKDQEVILVLRVSETTASSSHLILLLHLCTLFVKYQYHTFLSPKRGVAMTQKGYSVFTFSE